MDERRPNGDAIRCARSWQDRAAFMWGAGAGRARGATASAPPDRRIPSVFSPFARHKTRSWKPGAPRGPA